MTLPPLATNLDDQDWIFRRVPPNQWNLRSNKISPASFRPKDADTDGLSVSNSKLSTPYMCAFLRRPPIPPGTGPVEHVLWPLAAVPHSVLGVNGCTLVHSREELDPGHSLIPEINIHRHSDPSTESEVRDLMDKLAAAVHRVFPFDTSFTVDPHAVYAPPLPESVQKDLEFGKPVPPEH